MDKNQGNRTSTRKIRATASNLGDSAADDDKRSPERFYTPQSLSKRKLNFSGETLAAISDAELAFARFDSKSSQFAFNPALRRLLAHLEAIAIACIDGTRPDLELMLSVSASNFSRRHGIEDSITPRNVISDAEAQATHDALCYSKVIQAIGNGAKKPAFDTASLLAIHQALQGGEQDFSSESSLRAATCSVQVPYNRPIYNIYIAPSPSELPHFVDDLMEFCDSVQFSPFTQASIAYYQMELISPFEAKMGQTSSALCHAITRKRSLGSHLIPPLAMSAVKDVPKHARALFHYKQNRCFSQAEADTGLERWLLHSADCLSSSAELIGLIMHYMSEMEAGWERKLGGVRKGSAVGLVLQELPSMPIVSIHTAMAATGKGFSASNEAVKQLVSADILTPMDDDKRNRVYVSKDALAFIKSILNRNIPRNLVARYDVYV